MHLLHNDIQIRERAYAIWEREGRPEGHEWDHWVRAAGEVGSGQISSTTALDGRHAPATARAKASRAPGREKPGSKARRPAKAARG